MVYVPPAGAFFFSKNTPLDFWSMYLVDLVKYLENLVVIRAGGTRVQGLGEPPGTRRGSRWAVGPEGIRY